MDLQTITFAALVDRALQHHVLVVSYLSKQQNQQEQQLLSDITVKQNAAKVTLSKSEQTCQVAKNIRADLPTARAFADAVMALSLV